jgi:hypothetical protein
MLATGANNTWGSHGLVVEECVAPCAQGEESIAENIRVYIQDFY